MFGKKSKFIFFIVIISLLLLSGCSNKTSQESNYNTEKLSIDLSSNHQIQEIKISDYSTKLIGSDKNRNNNIDIACKSINETIVAPGETFSFWSKVGKTTTEKGYKEADAFNSNGETIQALGGGICQISSTLYNAVLSNKNLEVIERHPHSNSVAYVPEGKDASVNYGTADFKFKNNSDYSIKILSRLENKKVIVEIYELH